MLSFDDSDWPAIFSNLQRVLMKWESFSHLLGQEGDDIRTSGRFYVAVVQSVLLLGS